MKKVILLIFIAIIPYEMWADSPAMPIPYVEPSSYGSFYFKMIPEVGSYENGEYEIKSPAYGVAYELLENGDSRELWEVQGWYAFQVYLSNEAEYLVRMGNWASGKKPSKEDLAVAFYHKGVLLKEYSTADLIKIKRSVQRTVSHYFWRSDDQEFPKMEYKNKFLLKTIENRLYTFDISTGEIIEEKKL
ncbi:hypothetical protein [Teredinibacter purpureus]|uniref:hypothetical protein n=1 Tax=Teredinibacter purpureus TaxID=2731756 RepID=UPI0013C4FF01|nr:hypothetical protein [Teredinibacter purpureus]